MSKLTIEQASTIIAAALERGGSMGLKPLVVAVLDAGGHMKAYAAQDGTSPGRFEVACGKARGALLMGSSSRALNDQAGERPHFLAGLGSVIPGGIVPVPGGLAFVGADGEVSGAVGISGDTSDNDEACAVAGIEAAGLKSGG